MKKMRSSLLVSAVAGAFLLSVGACSSNYDSAASGADGSFKPVKVDLGNGVVTVKKPIENIAFIVGGSKVYTSNVGYMDGAKAAADAAGVHIDFLEPNFDPALSYQMVQTAMSSGKYDAIAVQGVDPSTCDLVASDALKYQVLVVGFVNELCAVPPSPDDAKLRAPGSVAYVGGQNTYNDHVEWLKQVMKANPGPQKAIVVLGPEGNAGVQNFQAAFNTVMKEDPNLKVAAYVYTDYTTPTAYQKMGPALQANPDATIVLSHYVDLTVGAAQAMDDLHVHLPLWETGGGSKVSVKLMNDGKLDGTWPLLPYNSGEAAVNALLDAAAGKKVPPFLSGNGDEKLGLTTKDTLAGFKPQW